jgi:hypothetical protein
MLRACDVLPHYPQSSEQLKRELGRLRAGVQECALDRCDDCHERVAGVLRECEGPFKG